MAQSKSQHGSAAAPTAGAPIVSNALGSGGAAIAPGFYRVNVYCKFTAGAPAAADVDNFQLVVDGTVVGPCESVAALNVEARTDFLVNASQLIQVQAVGAGTGGVTYDCTLVTQKDG